MEKCVFIVEDRTKDIRGFLLALQVTLLHARRRGAAELLSAGDLKLFFLHVCWDDQEEVNGKASFETAVNAARELVRSAGREAFQADYCPLRLDDSGYDPNTCPDYGRRVLEEQKRLLTQELGRDIELPDAGAPCYAVLLDVVLNRQKDEGKIQDGGEVLSSWLYRQYTAARCAVYSEYPPVSMCEKWKSIARMDEPIIAREYISRGRAIHLGLQQKLYQALDLE